LTYLFWMKEFGNLQQMIGSAAARGSTPSAREEVRIARDSRPAKSISTLRRFEHA
jgi:hypothetical protein